ncbi:hypothetical protein X798_00873 [Onchocerca flexuosa]|uniref:Uncharacterized protein n=1 Tax=Onchocerca flexuosa TaxID=387005 RepID=A0A238C4F5_9BILA|nr:hypothetical protein X798_00873 [Onchocerca flexuosa]
MIPGFISFTDGSHAVIKPMWYEQIYSSVITVACVAITVFTMLPVNLIETGHKHRRYMHSYILAHMRDFPEQTRLELDRQYV